MNSRRTVAPRSSLRTGSTACVLGCCLLWGTGASAQLEVIHEPDDDQRTSIRVIQIVTESAPTTSHPDIVQTPARKRPPAGQPVVQPSHQPPESPLIEQAMVVLDGSGSMWAQIDGRSKIQVARQVITDITLDWDPSFELGLMSYGHRAKGDCSDIETLIAPIDVDAARFATAVNGINPKGKTPITQSVINAAEALKYTEHKATVILISDGKETCHMDPCDAAVTLERYGIDFTAHVISFDVPFEQTVGLRCLAETTGGMYLEAGNAHSLKAAMQHAVNETTDKSALTVAPVSLSAPATVVGGAAFQVAWTGVHNAYDRVVVVDPSGTLRTTGYVSAAAGQPQTVSLDAPETPGDYRIQYLTREHHVLGKSALTVVTAEATLEPIPDTAAGRAFDVHWTGPANRFDALRIVDGQGKSVGARYLKGNGITVRSPARLTAPEAPGVYEVIYETRAKKALTRTRLVVTATTASVRVPTSVPAGAPVEVHWNGPRNAFDELRILDDQGTSYASRYVRGSGLSIESPVELVAPETPGTYRVVYETRLDKVLGQTSLVVTPTLASIRVASPATAGAPVTVHWSGPAHQHDHVQIVDGNGTALDKTFLNGESPIVLTAPEVAGMYQVIYQTRLGKTLARGALEVTAAVASVSAPASVVAGSPVSIDWAGPVNRFDQLRIIDDHGKALVSQYLQSSASQPVSPMTLNTPEVNGRYRIVYATRQGRLLASTPLTIEPAHASLSAPAIITANATFDVHWSGPANAHDKLKLLDADGKTLATHYLNSPSKRLRSPLTLKAPKTAGSYRMIYETRYKHELAKADITVQAKP